MPTVRLRKRLLDRLVRGASSAGELGLALLMTAGVVHCGSSTQSEPGADSGDSADHRVVVEAAYDSGTFVEAAWSDGGPRPVVEAAIFPDAGSDAHVSPMPEAPVPVPDAGSDAHVSPMPEAPVPVPDAGSDAHVSPMPEAPVPVPDAGSDAHVSPMPEAPVPVSDAGFDARGPVVEAATFPDAHAPFVEAAFPDAGSDASRYPWVEAPR